MADDEPDYTRRTDRKPCLATVIVGDGPASVTPRAVGRRDVHGILLQHPVPRHIDERAAFEAIAPHKDVDGVTMHSFAGMSFGHNEFVSCTPRRHHAPARRRLQRGQRR